jgi:hypothetical protein
MAGLFFTQGKWGCGLVGGGNLLGNGLRNLLKLRKFEHKKTLLAFGEQGLRTVQSG